MRLTKLARPRTALLGFALFLSVNATSVWGGVFPFLPEEFQVTAVTVSFFSAQTIASALAYVAAVLSSYFLARWTNRVLPHMGTVPMLLGSCALIAAMYVRPYALWLVIGSGALLGVGSTGMMLVWQRVLASQDSERATMLTIAGTGASALVYFLLCLCPLSVTAFLVPLVFLPLCGTALALSYRDARARGGLPDEPPTEHPRVYARVVRDYWRSGLTVGSLGFVAGVVRAIAIENVDVGQVVNITSMLGALVSAVALVVLWRRFSFRFSTSRAMRVVFPVLIGALALLPFLSRTYLDAFAGFVHMLFAFAQMILIVQCLQAARDRGVDAAFVYGLCGGIATVLQCLGLLCGWATGAAQVGAAGLAETAATGASGPAGAATAGASAAGIASTAGTLGTVAQASGEQGQIALAALLCACALGMALYLICAGSRRAMSIPAGDEAEFLLLAPLREAHGTDGHASSKAGSPSREETPAPTGTETGAGPSAPAGTSHAPMRDRISKQCEAIRLHFRLSARETEVMEHIARGDTVPRIASEIEVSENTVRTHAKRIYAKLGIHSKQELGDLIAQFRPADV